MGEITSLISLFAALITILGSPLLPKLLSQDLKNKFLVNAISGEGEGFLLAQYWLWTGADPNITNKHGWTPLQLASYRGNSQLVQKLVEHGADIESPDSSEKSALILSIRNCERWNPQKFEIMKYLLEHGADTTHAMLYAEEREDDEYTKNIIEILNKYSG